MERNKLLGKNGKTWISKIYARMKMEMVFKYTDLHFKKESLCQHQLEQCAQRGCG